MEESHRKGEEDLKAGFESERLRKIRFLEKDLKREMDDIIKGLVATFYKWVKLLACNKINKVTLLCLFIGSILTIRKLLHCSMGLICTKMCQSLMALTLKRFFKHQFSSA